MRAFTLHGRCQPPFDHGGGGSSTSGTSGRTISGRSLATSSATPPPTAEPTATQKPIATSTQACPPVTGTFATAWNAVQKTLGCATVRVYTGQVVEENFINGKMFWREPVDTGQALVVFNNGTWQIFHHTPYLESSPEFTCLAPDTPAQCPPTPRRGFGMMWCDIAAIRSGLGNATNCEESYTGAMQDFEHGFMLRSISNAVYVFYDTGIWEKR